MKNTLMDLNNHLFEQMERLNDDDLSNEQLEKETQRAKTMIGISTQIINNANLIYQAERLKAEYGGRNVNLPRLLNKDDA